MRGEARIRAMERTRSSGAPFSPAQDATVAPTARRSSPARTSALVSTLHSIFGDFEPKVLAMVLFAHDHDLEQAVNALLNLDTSDAQHGNEMLAGSTLPSQAHHKHKQQGAARRVRSRVPVEGHSGATTWKGDDEHKPRTAAASEAGEPAPASAALAAARAARRHTRVCLASKIKSTCES